MWDAICNEKYITNKSIHEMGESYLSNLNFRGVSPEIAELIRKDKEEHAHKNMAQTLECIVEGWAQQRMIEGFDPEKAQKLKDLLQNLKEMLQKLEFLIHDLSIGCYKT